MCLDEAKMAARTINVVNSFSTVFPNYLLFFKKTVSVKTLNIGTFPEKWWQSRRQIQ